MTCCELFVLAMVVDHVRGPSPLWLLTGGNQHYVSAAELILTSDLAAWCAITRQARWHSLPAPGAQPGPLYLLTIGSPSLSPDL
jgi:hypothetical protein